jgi:ribosomal protein S18 acetylase RimI-like enzyme
MKIQKTGSRYERWLHQEKDLKELPQEQVEIRVADASDAEVLAELGARTYIDAFGVSFTPEDLASYLASSFSPSIQAAELGSVDTLFLVASCNRKPAGYAKLRVSQVLDCVRGANSIELERFFVESAWHGLGVSHLLMKEVLKQARERGHDFVWLGVWEHNERAIGFYRKWDFEIIGENNYYLGGDLQSDYVMSVSLDPAAGRGLRQPGHRGGEAPL